MHGAEVLASGDTLPEQNGPGKMLTTTCVMSDTSRVSENPVEVPRGASWSTSASTLAQEDAPTPMLQAVEDEYTRVELDCVPLPPLPPSARGRVASRVRSRAEHREPSSSSGSEASCRNDAPRHFAWGRLRKRRTARKLSSRSKGMWGHGTDHWMSPWASRAGGTSSSSSATVPTSSTTDSSSSSTSPTAPSPMATDSSSSSSSPESPLPTAPNESPPRSAISLEDAVVVRTTSAEQNEARRSLWDITVAMSKSTVTVALVQPDRSVLYRIPLVWLLSELGVCANNENTKALLNFGGGGCSHAPVTVNVARMFRPLEGEDDLARMPLGRLLKESPPRMPTAAEQATLTLRRPWHGDGALAPLKDVDATPAHLTAALCEGSRGPRGVAASKWTRKCRRKTTLALRELFRDGGLVSVLHRVRTAPGLPASDAGAAVRREAECPAVHSAPVLSTAASCPRPEPPCSSTQLTLDRRKSPPPPPPPRASPRRRGRKRSLSLGSEPLAKLPVSFLSTAFSRVARGEGAEHTVCVPLPRPGCLRGRVLSSAPTSRRRT
ncbi:uncharacterized protein LOC127750081 [Frankliniella occidentalis]|uniref:Uncharacterized protein LOC127750081 n=1 Tax=Frankliniella occidentalis TaxID=133901 RepID=A0A9C6UAG3_FRAOC|nr:uncharacterized protein LOC127750081 [Frankliniella occidentalis]